MNVLYQILGWIMKVCYDLCKNYGIAIILFTLISKIVLLPVSVWVVKNSIKLVKMQPEINFMKVKFFGDKDAIAEEQAQIYKREKYSPFASVIPLFIQIILLLGLVGVIKEGVSDSTLNMMFCGIDLSIIPSEVGGAMILVPIIAGLSSWILCVAQNVSNILQAEQSKMNQYGTLIFSVALSAYLGWFVPVGVAVYWIASNLLTIVQLYVLNWIMKPKNYIDYEQLEKSKKALDELQNIGGKKRRFNDAESKRERADYKKFFSVVNKKIVFYSESSGFYKYFKGLIEYLLENTNLTIHYITSDPNDAIFELSKVQNRIRPYYIAEKKLITLMMKLEADIVLMTMPDLENFHIKRSYLKKDIEYIYIPHGIISYTMVVRPNSLDNYDTVFCVGKHHNEEFRKQEEFYGTKEKNLINWGYTLLDEMRADYALTEKRENEKKTILIAPSYQKDNIMDSCLEEILDKLQGKGYMITVRPHPQHVRHKKELMEQLKVKYENVPDVDVQIDFSSNNTVFEADLMITDWSGVSFEYAFTTQKPVLYINTPMKVMNPDYQKIGAEQINVSLRNEIGYSLDTDKLDSIDEVVDKMFQSKDEYYEKIGNYVNEYVYNLGNAAEVGGKYIIGQLQKKIKERKGEK